MIRPESELQIHVKPLDRHDEMASTSQVHPTPHTSYAGIDATRASRPSKYCEGQSITMTRKHDRSVPTLHNDLSIPESWDKVRSCSEILSRNG
jgi:hypothetical protein